MAGVWPELIILLLTSICLLADGVSFESYLLDNHVWTHRILCPFLGCVKTLLGGRSLLERRIGSMLSRTPEEDIYSEQSQGADSDADFSTFFPRWSVIFAPFGFGCWGGAGGIFAAIPGFISRLS